MKSVILIACLIFSAFNYAGPAFTQPPDTLWTRTYGGSEGDWGRSVQQSVDGGFIIAGTTSSFGAGHQDFALVKTDPDGNVLWSHAYGGTNQDVGQCAQETTDGGIIVVGYTKSLSVDETAALLVKTDAGGNELWSQTIGGPSYYLPYSIQQTEDNGYILAGNTGDYSDDNSLEMWLVKTDSNGNPLWSHTYGGAEAEYGRCVQQTNDGGYIIAGSTKSYDDLYHSIDVMLVKTDANGGLLWIQVFGGAGMDSGYYVRQTSDGGYIITGRTAPYGASQQSNVLLIKTDPNGDELWSQTFGGSSREIGYCVQQTSDNGYIITGFTHSFAVGSNDVWLIKTDADGNESWSQTFGGTSVDEGYCVQQTYDGGYVVVGLTFFIDAGYYKAYLIRVAADGNVVGDSRSALAGSFALKQVYPNPFNPIAALSIQLPKPSDLNVSVYNAVGQEVTVLADGHFAQGQQQFTFDATGLSTGIYFVRATVPGQMNATKKIVYLK